VRGFNFTGIYPAGLSNVKEECSPLKMKCQILEKTQLVAYASIMRSLFANKYTHLFRQHEECKPESSCSIQTSGRIVRCAIHLNTDSFLFLFRSPVMLPGIRFRVSVSHQDTNFTIRNRVSKFLYFIFSWDISCDLFRSYESTVTRPTSIIENKCCNIRFMKF
jgi:hypothetical protein